MVNLAVVKLGRDYLREQNWIDLWEAWDREEWVKRVDFEIGETFCLGCFQITVTNLPFIYFKDLEYNDFIKQFIDKVVFRYKKCRLTVELYKKDNLIETIVVDDSDIIERNNARLTVLSY